jgi:hypothetical protein
MQTEAKTPALARAALQHSISSTLVAQQNMYANMGWGLKQRKPPQHLSIKQKKFIYDTFMKGEETGRKVTALKLSKTMKTALNPNGGRLFHTNEFLTTNQIMSQFSRLSAQCRNNSVINYLKSTTLEEDDEDSWLLKTALEENEMYEEYSALENFEKNINFDED